ILAVFVFHSSRFFDTDNWHVKNPTTYFGAQVWITFMANWLMPFIFAISGASLYYALGSRGARKFMEDKVKRLLVPLIVGIFTHIMLQVYLERLTHRQFFGSFFDFIPHYFDGWYGFDGNFAWMGLHLWYLLILFLYSLLFYPLFRWLSAGFGRQVLDKFGTFLSLPGMVYILGLPVAGLLVVLDPREPIGMREFGGWPLWNYMLFFLYGFIVIAHEGLQKRIMQVRWISLAAGVLSFFALFALWASKGDPSFGSSRWTQVFGIFGMSSWCWLLAFFGFGMKHLNFKTRFMTYANEAVLPFYILHQTVLLCIGYFVVRWGIPDLLKFFVTSMSSFTLIVVLYEYLVRRINILRILFGMKPMMKTRASSSKIHEPVEA
ncbi:MAG: acyltransferase family protein, partial [Anaerolineales bacterium]